jgi:hypothetical protein
VSIEAWVTDPTGAYICHLDRSEASPFRNFKFTRDFGESPGALEYNLDNALVREHDDLFAFGNLVFMRYRDRTRAWVVEERATVLDEAEAETDWVQVAGRGTKQLAFGDRIVWPSAFDEAHTDPLEWGAGGWKSKLDAVAAVSQNVVPVASTTGASVGIPVEITGGHHRQIGIIESIIAGVSVTLVDELAFTFPKGSRIIGATKQWRRFVNRAAGEMLWDLLAESNPRFPAQITRGTVETTGTDGWTQDFRFDSMLDIVGDVERLYGDVELEGLEFNYYNAIGVDRTATVILEEGADLTRLSFEENDRDTITWVVAEGTGEAVYAKLIPKKKTKKNHRKTPRKGPLRRRKAPPAPKKKAELVRVDYPILEVDEETDIVRVREAYLDAKDVTSDALLDETGRAALEEHALVDGIGFEAKETRYRAEVEYGLGDWIRIISPSRGIDEDVRLVAETFAEVDDELVVVSLDANTRRQEALVETAKPGLTARASIGVQNRQPQGQLVPFSFSGADVFDDTDTMDVFLFIPDRMYLCVEAHALVRFREYFAPAKSAASGGGATTGGTPHVHDIAAQVGSTGGKTLRQFSALAGEFDLDTNFTGILGTDFEGAGVGHTHSTPNHTHGLAYGVFKEAYPAGHSVTVKVYELEDDTWNLVATLPALAGDIEDVDLSAYIVGPGNWRLSLKSDAAQPNGGRLGADVSGYVLGAIQSA